jgi:hypothetical protein
MGVAREWFRLPWNRAGRVGLELTDPYLMSKKMSLIADSGFKPIYDDRLRGMRFQMVSNDAAAPQPVRVVVTVHALADLLHAKVDDSCTAAEAFERLRAAIEAAATVKFDRIGPAIQPYEGVPTFLLMTGDPIEVA